MARNAFDGIDVLLIDGNNLLHRVFGSADPTAQRTLIPRLRNAIPSTIATLLMLDGHADAGTAGRTRIAKGLDVQHSGSMSADDALVRTVAGIAHEDRAATTLVTDDRSLTERARQMGARTQRLAWLEGIIGQTSASIGIGTPSVPAREDDEREQWRPGRHATKKRGNPRRAPRQGRG
jgi:rRNA-processing protein FCF1